MNNDFYVKPSNGVMPVSSGAPTGGVKTDYGEKGIGQGDDFNTLSHPTPSVDSSISSWSPKTK